MKKFIKIFMLVALAVISTALFVETTQNYSISLETWYTREKELLCYGVWGLTSVSYFYTVIGKIKKLWQKITAAVTASLLYTAAVLFANNFWAYLSINYDFCWVDPISYGALLKSDLTYTYGYGEFRYPALFAVTLLLCGFKIFVSHPRVKAAFKNMDTRLNDCLYFKILKRKNLEELYLCYVEDPDDDRVIDYVNIMPLDENGKTEMLSCVEKYGSVLLIYLMIVRFGELLSKEEYIKYKAIYIEILQKHIDKKREYYNTLQIELPDICKTLDERFNITKTE